MAIGPCNRSGGDTDREETSTGLAGTRSVRVILTSDSILARFEFMHGPLFA
jgi:hypothetical protein